MKKLLKYLKPYLKETVASPVLKLFEVCLELGVPFIIAGMIDKGINAGDTSAIISRSLILFGFALAGLCFAAAAQYFAAKAACGFVADMRQSLFAHIQRLTGPASESVGTSFLLNVITEDMNQMQTGVNLFLRLLLRSPFIVFGATAAAFTIDVKAASVFLPVIAILAAVIFAVMFFSMKLYANVKKKQDRLLEITRENLSGARVVRSFCREDTEEKRFKDVNKVISDISVRSNNVSALMTPLTYIVINCALTLILYICMGRFLQGDISQGSVVALCNYLSLILTELIKLANLIFNLSKSIAAGRRIQSVFDLPEELGPDGNIKEEDTASYDGPLVSFEDVSFTYEEASEPALSHIDLTLSKGGSVGIIGGTGSGKSTIASLIYGFCLPTQGTVKILGMDTKTTPAEMYRKYIKTSLQDIKLFKGTVRENMLWGNENASDEEIIEALKDAEAYDFVFSKGGLDFRIRQTGRNLSGGQKQRLSVARALLGKPEILILDDSFSALDFLTESRVRKNILKKKDLSVIVISQRISSLRGCDRIIVTDDGKIAGVGTFEQLLSDCTVFRDIYETQTKKEGPAI